MNLSRAVQCSAVWGGVACQVQRMFQVLWGCSCGVLGLLKGALGPSLLDGVKRWGL